MILRVLSSELKDYARQYPIVTVTGPRQSGKTTLVRNVFPSHTYVSLEDLDKRMAAINDHEVF